ncbi:MAG: LTA synthase family protein [Alistipes sp.]|nr:LTA synthase family protein [Alistipes sp.]
MTLQKPLFLLWYAELASEAEVAELWGVVSHGLSLDATMAGYICAIPILLTLLCLWLPSVWWHRLQRVWCYTAAVIVAVTFSVNLGLYEFWGFPLDGSVFQYLATPKEAMASVTVGQFCIQSLVAVVYGALLIVMYNAVLKIFKVQVAGRWGRKVVYTLLLLLIAGVDFLAIRGGTTTAVANVSKAYFSDKTILNHAAVNPTFSLLSSISDGENLDRYNYFSTEQCAAQMATIMAENDAEPTENLLSQSRPNIVLILAESFGRTTTDCTVGGQVVAPNLQRLKGEGVWFENMIASSFRTDRGVLATLSGFCSQPTMSIMKEPQRASHLPSIARSLRREGYRTSYIHGGDLNFTNMASYLYATGFDKLVAYKDLHFDAPTSKWGYADDVLADYFTGHIKEQSEQSAPYFAVWQTLSSHEPFDVPTAVFEDKMLSSMHFADSCIGRVVESLRQSEEWDNTLIIIVADHAYPYPYGISASAVERHRIPMLWLGGALKRQKRVDSYCSQSDFAATLLAQLGIAHNDFLLSRDIFAPNPHKFGYYTFNNGFGVVDTTGSTIYDCTTESVILEGSAEQEQIGKTMLQSTYNIIKQL